MLGCDTESWQVERRQVCFLNVLHIEGLVNHADSAGVVGDGVDQDEGSGGPVLGIGVEEERLGCRDLYLTNLVEAEVGSWQMFHRIDIHTVVDGPNLGTGRVSAGLEEELLAAVHRLFVHPYQFCLQVTADKGQVIGLY